MVRFEDVDEKTTKALENREGRRGTITKPIIDEFLKSDKSIVKITLEESGSKSITSLYLGLKNYLRTRLEIKIDVLMHEGEVYLKKRI